MFKRFGLLILVNFGIMLTLLVILNLLGVRGYLTPMGIDYPSLMIFCLVYGMGGSFISLLMSKKIAKWTMGLQMIKGPGAGVEGRIYEMVERLAKMAQLPRTPEVAIYPSREVNAFATGPSRSNSLVAVSAGLLHSMDEAEVEGVLAHEVAHIANGDMVTMTLLQGVINAFVMFFAKAVAWAAASALGGRNSDEGGGSPSFFLVFALEMVLYMVFGLIGGMIVSWFSRHREYRADAGGAAIAGRHKMIAALERLRHAAVPEGASRDDAMATLKISGGKSLLELLSTHPPLEARIERLRRI